MRTAAIVLAAGRGVRAGGTIPKQYCEIGNRPIILRALEAFIAHPGIDAVQPVISEADRDLYQRAAGGLGAAGLLEPVPGGVHRQASALAGLRALACQHPEHVLIHDSARPFVDQDTISRVLDALSRHDGVIPAIGISDGVWSVDPGRTCRHPMDREALCRAQTPQGFRFPAILAAHEACVGESCFDDASVATKAGITVACVAGNPSNLKLTTPEDLVSARRALLANRELRIGQGFDVHAFGSGEGARLCGVDVPDCPSLEGHSDADVGLHALTDAIYGAIAEGDIGEHFPATDPAWKDCGSELFLRDAIARAANAGFEPLSADITLICELPRIAPHRQEMRAAVASELGIPRERVSVKATTTERLGFTGRGEGIAVMALATLRAQE